MELWSEKFTFEITLSKYYISFDSHGDVINLKLGQKEQKLVQKTKVNSKVKFEVKCSFLKPLFQNFEVLTFRGDVINPNIGQKVNIGISCTNVNRKIKIKSSRFSEVNYSFMELFYQNLEVYTQHGDVINPKLARERVKLVFHGLIVTERQKIKSKRDFEVWYLFMKLFSRSFEIMVLYCDAIISKNRLKFVYHLQLAVKILKSETIITLVSNFGSNFFLTQFWNFDLRCDVIILKLKL